MNKINLRSFFFIITALALMLLPDIMEARGSFGGSRGGGRSGGSFRSSRPSGGSSFGGTRSSTPPNKSIGSTPRASSTPRSSFGGNRVSNAGNYRSKYGVPRQSTPMAVSNGRGGSNNYIVHNYGGYSSGLMTGYMMGSIPFMWHTPFHPAYYYSRPVEVVGANGVVEVYPPEFSFAKLFFTLIIVALVIWLIVAYFKRRNANYDSIDSQSSFS